MQAQKQRNTRVTRRPATKKNHLVATGAGLAISLVASGGAIANAASADAVTAGVDVSALAQQAKTVAAQNLPVVISEKATWSADSLNVEVNVHDAREERRVAAEQEAQQRARAAELAASRTAARQDLAAGEENAPVADVPLDAANGSIAAIASRYVGARYVWGGTTPAGFDCSGFTAYVYRQAGINLPHSSSAQRARGTQVSMAEAQPGDLLWQPGHVGIYLGNGKMIHAGTPRTGVQITNAFKSMRAYRVR